MDNIVLDQKVLNLDKSNWVLTKLDELAHDISKRVDNPAQSDYDRFVGLDHFASGDIKIKNWGTTENLSSSAKAFKAGDILFARRNAYLRRASLVDFDGCCSGDAFVLRENLEKVVPGFLAFLMNSNSLWDYANSNAAGTMSKRVKWRDLAEYEFLLPPKAEQSRLAELLWAMDEVIEREREVLERLTEVKSALQRKTFEDGFDNYIKIEQLAKVYSGGTPNRKINNYWGGSIPWIKTAEVNYQVINEVEEYITEEGLKNSAAKLIPPGSVLVAMYGQGVTRGRVAITGIEASCNQACAIIETSDVVNTRFIYSYLEYKYDELRSLAHGANQQNLNLGMIKEFNIPDLDTETKESFLKNKMTIDINSNKIQGYIIRSKALQKSLINQIFQT
jgi:type I restriction enzyme S subunit